MEKMEKMVLMKISLFFVIFGSVLVVNFSLISVRVVKHITISEAPLLGQYDAQSTVTTNIESFPLVAPSPARRRRQRLPSCLIIGARKGGTRALLDLLAVHPLIRVARQEVHFFNCNRTYSMGVEWYRKQMPYTYSEQVTIEKTPAYFTSKLAAQRVHQMNSSIKIILIVRDPVVRTISDFTQVVHTKYERNKTRPQFEAEAFLNDSTQSLNINYKPIRNSLYSKHMEHWLHHFPLQNFLIVDGDKFVTDPLAEVQKVERFLHLPNMISADQLMFNHQKGFYCFRRKDRRMAKCLGNTKGRLHVNISSDTRSKLRQKFSVYNEQFFKMVNRWWSWQIEK